MNTLDIVEFKNEFRDIRGNTFIKSFIKRYDFS